MAVDATGQQANRDESVDLPSAPTVDVTAPSIDARLRPPPLRRGLVGRPDLVDRLVGGDAPVTSIVAPPGYGKTTLLAQWAAVQPGDVAWLTLDVGDDDVATLVADMAAALGRVQPIAVDPIDVTDLQRPAFALATLFLDAVGRAIGPITLVLDQLETVTDPVARECIVDIAARVPEHVRLVLASSTAPPVARIRAAGRLEEIWPSDLAMGHQEAVELLDALDVSLPADQLTALVAETEGWAAGLYLSGLAQRAGLLGDAGSLATPAGTDRFVSDYLRAAVLEQLAPDDADFLVRTSVLDRINGELCDAVLESEGSAARLARLSDQNLLLVPLDRTRDWYRYHQLLRDFLRAELRHRHPGSIPEVHTRAAGWFEQHGELEEALRHAQLAPVPDRAANLVAQLAQPTWARGRSATVQAWFRWLEEHVELADHPELALHGSLMHALDGRAADAARWAAVAEAADGSVLLEDGCPLEGQLAYLRAIRAEKGVDAMRADAEESHRLLAPTSPYRPTMLFTQGLAAVLLGDLDQADAAFVDTHRAATAIDAVPLAAMALAERCAIAFRRDDTSEARRFGRRALELVEDGGFDEYWTSAIVFAWAARLDTRTGQAESARAHLAAAQRLRPLLTRALPVVSVQALVQMARVYVALADPRGADAVLGQASDILGGRIDLGDLHDEVAALDDHVEQLSRHALPPGPSSLTAAELRLAPLLATHLSMREIGQQLYVSRNTVKTHTVSIYRKLAVSSRSEAVDRMRELGMLGR